MEGGDLDSEGWKQKFLSLQAAYEDLLASTVDYEEDLNNEIEESQRQEREARNELSQLQGKMTDLVSSYSSQRTQVYQRVDQLEAELRIAHISERDLKHKVRALEQEKDNLERQQRQLQAEVEDQSDRLQNAIEEQEFLRIKIEEGTVEEVLKIRLGLLEKELHAKSQECTGYYQRLGEQSHQIEELNSSVTELSKNFLDVKGRNASRLAWLERENRLIGDKDRLLAEKEKALLQAQNRIVALEKLAESKEAAHEQVVDAFKLLQLSRLNEVRRQTIVAAHLEGRSPTVAGLLPRSGSSTVALVPASPVVSVNSKIHFFHQLASSISAATRPKPTTEGHHRSQSSTTGPRPSSPSHHRTQTAITAMPTQSGGQVPERHSATFVQPGAPSTDPLEGGETKDTTAVLASSNVQHLSPSISESLVNSVPVDPEDVFALKEELWSTRRQLIQLTRNLERWRLRTESDDARIAQLQASLLEEQLRSSAILQALTTAQAALFERAAVENEPDDLRAENRVLTLRNKALEADIAQSRRPQQVQRNSIMQPARQEVGNGDVQCGVLNMKDADSWKPRYYVVNPRLQVLECFVMTNGGAVNRRCGSVNLHGSTILSYADKVDGQEHCFGVTAPFSRKTLILQANSAAERDAWVAALSGCVSTKQKSFSSFIEGHLELETEGQWVRRYFVLTSNCLHVFDKASERHLLMGFDLSDGAKVRDVPKKLLRTTHALLAFTLQNAHQSFVLKATSEAERHSWVSNILAVVAPLDSRMKQAGPAMPLMLAACFAATGKVIYLETSSNTTVSTLAGLLRSTSDKAKDFLVETTWSVAQSACFLCLQEFNWKSRKQGCHNCGQSVCQTCSAHIAVVFKGLGKTGSVPSRICDVCYVSVFFGQEHLPADALTPPSELSLSWHGVVMPPSAQLSDFGVDNKCLIRVHDPCGIPTKLDDSEIKFDEVRRPSWRATFNSASQSLKMLRVKRSSARPSTPISADRPTREISTTAKPRLGDDLWEGIDGSELVSSVPRSPSVFSFSEAPQPPPLSIAPAVLLTAPTAPLVTTIVSFAPQALPAEEVSALSMAPPALPLVKEGFVDQMFGNHLKANWKRRHLALSSGAIVFSSVRIPLPKIAKDGSVIGAVEGSYLRELGSILLTGQSGYQVLSSEGQEYGRAYVFSLITPGRTYVWSATSAETRDQWVQRIRQFLA